ncbi:MAG: hypothetical protein EA351_11335 [Gemmatimonadales bacterium]|nr:MAG: hypothetical protein EA351_11335 [Gemmatimonadales bacterium]
MRGLVFGFAGRATSVSSEAALDAGVFDNRFAFPYRQDRATNPSRPVDARPSSPPPSPVHRAMHRAERPLDWLVVGGGIHGTHLTRVLLEAGVRRSRIRVVDPEPELLAVWTEHTTRTGMRYLRSPGVHHLGLDPFDLFRFAGRRRARRRDLFKGQRRRPLLSLFQDHARHVIGESGLQELHLRARVTGMDPSGPGGFRVETDRGGLHARRVLLCVGGGGAPSDPSWVESARSQGAPITHLFGPDLPWEDLLEQARRTGLPVAVVGGGISAGQFALRVIHDGGTAALLLRHELRVESLDADPGWLGPKNLKSFHAETDPATRRHLVQSARHRGSMPPEVAGAVRACAEAGGLDLRCNTNPVGCHRTTTSCGGDRWELILRTEGDEERTVPVSSVVLATGIGHATDTYADSGFPGGLWLQRLAREREFPTAPCGFPVPDSALQWIEGLHVSGALAELEVGPVAKNIVGARMAARRIDAVARSLS